MLYNKKLKKKKKKLGTITHWYFLSSLQVTDQAFLVCRGKVCGKKAVFMVSAKEYKVSGSFVQY